MPEIIFKEDTHEYFVDDIKCPCVSDIVKPLSIDYSKINEGALNHKRDLGRAFHHAIHLFLVDDLDWDSLDENLVEPMKGFKEFWVDDEFKGREIPKIEAMRIEEKMYHPKLHYCGTPDLVTVDAVYDWKFRKYDPVGDPLRMVGYEMLACEYITTYYPLKKIMVCFNKEGCYRRHEVDNTQAWGMFRKCLEKYNYDLKFNKLCEHWRKAL